MSLGGFALHREKCWKMLVMKVSPSKINMTPQKHDGTCLQTFPFKMVPFFRGHLVGQGQTNCVSQFIQGLAARELKHFASLEWHLAKKLKRLLTMLVWIWVKCWSLLSQAKHKVLIIIVCSLYLLFLLKVWWFLKWIFKQNLGQDVQFDYNP